jgi:hypothetical protein
MKRFLILALVCVAATSLGCNLLASMGPPCPLDRNGDGTICPLDFEGLTAQEIADLQADYDANPSKYSSCTAMLLAAIAEGAGIPTFGL